MGCGCSKEGEPAADGPRPPAGADAPPPDPNDGAKSSGSSLSPGSGRASRASNNADADRGVASDQEGNPSTSDSGSGRLSRASSNADPAADLEGSPGTPDSGSGRGGAVAVAPAGFGPPASATVKLPFNKEDFVATSGWNDTWDNPDPAPPGTLAPAATLKIILIRHGQHDKAGIATGTDADRTAPLNAHGRTQATEAGRKLAALVAAGSLTIDELHVSTMTRAAETADLIRREIAPNTAAVTNGLLCEGFPYPYVPRHPRARPWHFTPPDDRVEMIRDYTRFTSAFETYFKRPTGGQSKTIVIVCHANILKFFICKALQIPLEGYNRLRADNCGMSTITIDEYGAVRLEGMNDTCHLPARPAGAAAAE